MTKASCLLVVDAGGSAWVGQVSRPLAHVYYTLEDSDIAVNFASSSRVQPKPSEIQVLLREEEEEEEEEGPRLRDADTAEARAVEASLARFARDDRACEKLARSIALDRAVLFTGISFDGLCLVGDACDALRDSPKLEKMVTTMNRMGRVVGAFGGASAVVVKHLCPKVPPADCDHRGKTGAENRAAESHATVNGRDTSDSNSDDAFFDAEESFVEDGAPALQALNGSAHDSDPTHSAAKERAAPAGKAEAEPGQNGESFREANIVTADTERVSPPPPTHPFSNHLTPHHSLGSHSHLSSLSLSLSLSPQAATIAEGALALRDRILRHAAGSLLSDRGAGFL